MYRIEQDHKRPFLPWTLYADGLAVDFYESRAAAEQGVARIKAEVERQVQRLSDKLAEAYSHLTELEAVEL